MRNRHNQAAMIVFVLIIIEFGIVAAVTLNNKNKHGSLNDYSSLPASTYDKPDLASSLQITDLHVRDSAGLYYAVGEIKNTSSSDIDEIVQITFYDALDDLIQVKYINVKVSAGGTMAFDELVNTGQVWSAKIQDNYRYVPSVDGAESLFCN